MPPPKSSKSKNAHQHDKRHESGLAPPGKRIAKKLSNGHLNGKSASPSAGLNAVPVPSRAIESVDPFDVTPDDAVPPQCSERDRIGSDVSLDDLGRTGEMAEQQEHIPNVEVLSAGKRATFSSAGPSMFSVSTLLASYPLCDAISILILLLSLPPTLVLVIQTLFASLTFVPPTVSLSTIPNLKEIFNSSNFGYPALATILIVDVIFWMGWLLVRKSLQNIFLDLSQAVIAVSLSGASSSAGGPTYSIATCIAIVCVAHLLRYRAIHLTALDYLRSVIHKMDIGVQIDVPSFATNFISSPTVDRGWIHTVLRTIIGIHIVSQGVTTCIRRSLVKANEQSTSIPTITKSDTEAAIISEPSTRPNNSLVDGAQHSTLAPSSDSRAHGSLPANRDSKSRETINKKKRKQANQVRSQQPLWAAIASTKVTFVKEMEQRDAFDDSREAARMNATSGYSSNNPHSPADRIWISDVRDTAIVARIELSRLAAETAEDGQKDSAVVASESNSCPFHIRINGATWSSTRISMDPTEDEYPIKSEIYRCEIFGLAPMSNYHCEVFDSSSRIVCSVSVITQAASTAEQSASTPSQPPQPTMRPSSPSTTLKQSIQQAENKLNEARNRTKKNRKDQKAVHADIKREIVALKNKLESSNGADDKQERRLMQFNQHKSQAEEATNKLNEQIEALGDIPKSDLVEAEDKRKRWKTASSSKTTAEKDFDRAKAEAARELKDLESEMSQTKAKREKLAARLNQRVQELETLASKKEADVSARLQRESQRVQTTQTREHEESQFRFHTASFETEHQKVTQKTQDAYQEIAALQSWSTQSGQPPPYYSSPPTPENVFVAMNGSLGSPQSNGFPTFGSHAYQSPLHSAQASISNPQTGPRGRSSSMLSQYSGFTDMEPDPLRQQYSWPAEGHAIAGAMDQKERAGSSSLGSGSTGSNSPHPEVRPFASVGPIAPPNKEKSHPSQSSGTFGSAR